MQCEEKFVAFVDILGFKNMVEASEAGNGVPFSEILDILSKLGTQEDEDRFEASGPRICPQSRHMTKSLNFKITQVSDCVIVSSEISPAGIINLVSHCWGAVIELLVKGIMCRGYITKGLIYHKNNQVIGSGYQRAYAKESSVSIFKTEADERGTPFVEIDPVICDYVESSTDKCVKEMFSRMAKKSADNTTALFPFKRISHHLPLGGFDKNKEKESNNNVRVLLTSIKERILVYVNPENENAMSKAIHYLRAIEKQLIVCDEKDKMIDMLCGKFPAGKSFDEILRNRD